MSTIRVSTPGTDRQDVTFTPGQTLGDIFSLNGIDIPSGSGLEVWVNGEQAANWTGRQAADNDAVVLVPSLKGAKTQSFTLHLVR